MLRFSATNFLALTLKKQDTKKLTHVEKMKFTNANRSLFDEDSSAMDFISMPEIPYKFKLPFLDDSGKRSSMSIIDWEISQLYLNLKKSGKSEAIVLQKVKEKLEGFIEKNDLYLFLGTMRQMHSHVNNPYTIIGLFYPPKAKHYQGTLF